MAGSIDSKNAAGWSNDEYGYLQQLVAEEGAGNWERKAMILNQRFGHSRNGNACRRKMAGHAERASPGPPPAAPIPGPRVGVGIGWSE